jgi:hypothetical protein
VGCRIPAFLNKRATVSVGCAPTPIQYLERLKSSRMSLTGFWPAAFCSGVSGSGIGL